jgi:ABC-type sugar transport system permease subunit
MPRKHPDTLNAFLAIIPALILFAMFTYYPLVSTFQYSVTDWDGFAKGYNYVGFDNFAKTFQDTDLGNAFGNTIYFAVLSIAFGLVLQLGLATLLYRKFHGKSFFRAMFYLPCVISQLIASLTWLAFFQYTGVINEALATIGLGGFARDWIGSPDTVKNVLIFINLWQWTGYGMVIFLAGMTAIPLDVYESAKIDGASGIRQFFFITLPLLMPSITINLFIGITGGLKVFDMPFVLTKGGPIGSSQMLSMEIYDNAFKYERFGYSSAIGVEFFVFIAAITMVQLIITRRQEVEY